MIFLLSTISKGVKVISGYERFLKKNVLKKLVPLILVMVIAATACVFTAFKRKTITVVTDGKRTTFATFKDNVGDALAKQNIILHKKDKVNPPLTAKLDENAVISITKAVPIRVAVDGKTRYVKSAEKTVSAMLDAEKITLARLDKISPSKATPLRSGMKISITRVTTEQYTTYIELNYKTTVKINNALPNTVRNIVTQGRQGERKIITKITYHNGKQVSKKVISNLVTRKPVNTLIVQGGYMKLPVTMNGKAMAYTSKFTARTTAYWAIRGVGRTFTGSGRMAIRNPRGYSTVAVDRHLFPYGTKLFIEGYGFAVAADTGSAIIGKTIDVYFNTRKEACNWGVKYPTVYVLK